jgi:hypothetical protein
MATTQRSEYVDTAIRDLRLNPAIDSIPAHLAPDIQLTYQLYPRIMAITGTLVNATNQIILATGDRDVYIVGGQLSFVKDVTATATLLKLYAYIDGIGNGNLASFNTTTLTVEKGDTSFSVPYPGIRIDRNTSIALSSDTNAANFKCTAQIFYYVMSK